VSLPVQQRHTPHSAEPPYPSARAAWYAVGVLTLVYVFSFIDRQILSLLVRPIRRDLAISDFQMSLLMGFTFAVFYTFFGIPLGRLADSRSRRSIIALGFALWSLFTAGCGLVSSFAQMLLCRISVGVGEASLSPAAYSMIADSFPPHRRATAISVYGMGIYLGSGLAFLLGGAVVGLASAQETYQLPLVGATRPWQLIFFVVGLPGVLLAVLLYTLREPLRRETGGAGRSIPFAQAMEWVRSNKWTFLCHNCGFGFTAFASYAAASWVPTFLIRNHGWTASRAGIVFGLIVITAGSLGILFGGRFADWLRERGHRDANLRVAFYVVMISLPLSAIVYTASNIAVVFLCLTPVIFLHAAPFGVAPAAIQQIMPNAMRGQASAIYLFVNNLIGLGLGPSAVAFFTDYVFGDDNAVRYSMLVVSLGGPAISAALLYLGRKPFLASLDRLEAHTRQKA